MRNTDKVYPIGKTSSNLQRNTKYYFSEFCSNSSIHGLKFLGELKRPLAERVWWLSIILLALYICVTQILIAYNKWMSAPVIVTFATTETSIWEIPFPAVTICPAVKTNRISFNYTHIYLKKIMGNDTTPEEELHYQYMSLVCESDPTLNDDFVFEYNDTVLDFLTRVSPKLEEYVLQIEWKGKFIGDVFTSTFTNDGICHTYNILDRSEIYKDSVKGYKDVFHTLGSSSQWSIENGYPEGASMEATPRRTFVAGTKGGLTIVLMANTSDLDYVCGDTLQGFKMTPIVEILICPMDIQINYRVCVYGKFPDKYHLPSTVPLISLHEPTQIPQVNENYFRVPLDTAVVAAIKPNMMTTSEELKSYSPKSRQCYFSTEKYLRYFRNYNQENCLIECLTNFTLNRCGCVAFYMPREANTSICGSGRDECVEDAKAEVAQKLALKKNNGTKMNETELVCDCLPSCSSIKFDVETSQSVWEWAEYYRFLSQTGQFTDKFWEREIHISRLQIYFKEMQFINTERNELYGSTDFWANCGGLFGLFTGFSIISAFELLYYLTLRLYFNVRKFGRNYWSGAEEILQQKNGKNT